MLPRFGFTAYQVPSYLHGEYISTNPFTKSLDYSYVEVIDEVDGFYKLKFQNSKPGERHFYLSKSEMEFRGVWTTMILRVLMWPVFSIYNIFARNNDQ